MKKLLIILFAVQAIAQSAKPGGAEGTGGDPLYIKYVRARDFAVKIFRATPLAWVQFHAPRFAEFYKKHLNELPTDLENSAMELRDSNSNKKCGETTPNLASAKIWLGRDKCPTLDNFDKAEKETHQMLLGEAAHHFGLNDEEAAKFGIDIYESWRRGIPMEGQWSCAGDGFLTRMDLIRHDNGHGVHGSWYLDPTVDFEDAVPAPVTDTQFYSYPGKINFNAGYEYKKCRWLYTVEAKGNTEGTQIDVTITRPRNITSESCQTNKTMTVSYVCRRTEQSSGKYKQPWLWIYDGEILGPNPPNKQPWIHIYEK